MTEKFSLYEMQNFLHKISCSKFFGYPSEVCPRVNMSEEMLEKLYNYITSVKLMAALHILCCYCFYNAEWEPHREKKLAVPFLAIFYI